MTESGFLDRRTRFAIRAGLVAIGAGALAWSFSTLSGEREAEWLRTLSRRIVAGESIPVEALTRLSPLLGVVRAEGCASREILDAATIDLYIAARAQASSDAASRPLIEQARQTLRQALACSPHRAFLWYGLFWAEMAGGSSPESYLRLLETSYRLGPNEGWISFHRSADALPHFERLGPETQAHMRREYRSLVGSSPFVAASILGEADERLRARLLAWVSDLPVQQRLALATALDQLNLVIDVPGIEYKEGRPTSPLQR